MKQPVFDKIISSFQKEIQNFPDNRRTGGNLKHLMEDITLSAFSVFFTQSPSFLAHQQAMKKAKGKSNAKTLFRIKEIPTDNHIRDILDEVPPDMLSPIFDTMFSVLKENNFLDSFRSFNQNLLIALDGTEYFSSKKLHCDNCSTTTHKNGKITYHHTAILPAIVAQGQNKVISLYPEFITPQDGHDKQDCETAAAKRWVDKNAKRLSPLGVTILGDDLYSRQPLCVKLIKNGFHFIFVCKPDSHKTLYEWVELLEVGTDLHVSSSKRWNGKYWETTTYRYACDVPLRDSDDALKVNWFEVTSCNEEGEILYKNSFVTDHKITEKNVASAVSAGRGRWKTENENNNTLKTKGYNLEHNFGHGSKHLSSFLAALNILAFLFHTLLEFMDKQYRALRAALSKRKTFFDDIRALTRYICFESWSHMMNFMLEGLENKHIPDTG